MAISKKSIEQIQQSLKEKNLDGWLLYDFHGSNSLARRILKIPEQFLLTRRFFYWIPQQGDCQKIIHNIEKEYGDFLPGKTHLYISSKELKESLAKILQDVKILAMEYSPHAAIPQLSLIDAGTYELVANHKISIVSSADLLLPFTAVLTPEEISSHKEAAYILQTGIKETWKYISQNIGQVTDYDVQQYLLNFFSQNSCECEGAPICAIHENSSLPHFSPQRESQRLIKKGDFILVDLWCKKKGSKNIYADITRIGFVGQPSQRHKEIFSIVYEAQLKALEFLQKNKTLKASQVDDVCRHFIESKGYSRYFTHRTGHSIDVKLHGSGPNIDNFETHDHRPLLPGMCFSLEPGIYLPGEFGVRLETDVIIDNDNKPEITAGLQEEIFLI